MKHLWDTLKFSVRLAAHSPANTILCILVLATGIALVTSMFRVCQVVLFSSVPYKNADRMVLLERVDQRNNENANWPIETYKAFCKEQTSFSDIVATFSIDATVQNGGRGERTYLCYVNPGFDRTIGLKPVMGRAITEDDARSDAPRVVAINERIWREIFGSDPNAQRQRHRAHRGGRLPGQIRRPLPDERHPTLGAARSG
jgi:hypothetical protein